MKTKRIKIPGTPEVLTFGFARTVNIQEEVYNKRLGISRYSIVKDKILTSIDFPEDFVKEELFQENSSVHF